MKLENVTAEIRPRVPWESIDLGCALARRHFGVILKSWFLTVIPLWIVLGLLLKDFPYIFVFCIWWLKPIYDRIPLFVVSRALFGEVPRFKEVLKSAPRLMVRRPFHALLFHRFSFIRSLSLPISELEGLKGKNYRQRVSLLERNGGEGATLATVVGLLLELVAAFGFVSFLFLMIPESFRASWFEGLGDFFEYGEFEDISVNVFWFIAGVQMFAITLMEPFYVSAGFALYVNSRTITEGWDIELAFKRIKSRLSQTINTSLITLFALLSFSFLTIEKIEAKTSQETIEHVVADKDFTIQHKMEKVRVEEGRPAWLKDFFKNLDDFNLLDLFSFLGQLFFWLIVAALVAWIIFMLIKHRHIFEVFMSSSEKSRRSAPIPTAVMGMNVTPESLPKDIANAAKRAWEEGNAHLALSLLYRGSIVWMIHKADLEILESDTEGDCLRHAKTLKESGKGDYFSQLTERWIAVAYGKEIPASDAVLSLCHTYPFASSQSLSERRKV